MEKNFVRENADRVQADYDQQTNPDLEVGRESRRRAAD